MLQKPTQQKSMLLSVFPKPTGYNGYEDYLRAADLSASAEFRSYASWTGKPPEKADDQDPESRPSQAIQQLNLRLSQMTQLAVYEEWVTRFGKCLDLIAAGNQKPISFPTDSLSVEATFPEFSSFRQLAKFQVAAARVHLARGKQDQAVSTLLDTLQFANGSQINLLIGYLVGSASQAVALQGIDKQLNSYSLPSLRRLDAYAAAFLAKPDAIKSAMIAEGVFQRNTLKPLLKSTQTELIEMTKSEYPEDAKSNEKLSRAIKALTPSQISAIGPAVAARVERRQAKLLGIYEQPESQWMSLKEEDEPEAAVDSFEGLIDYLVQFTAPVFSSANRVALIRRTQMRLLRLHCQVQIYRWEHGELPRTLAFVPAALTADPITGKPFSYKVLDSKYELYTDGFPGSGRIDLVYKRPKDNSTQEQIEP